MEYEYLRGVIYCYVYEPRSLAESIEENGNGQVISVPGKVMKRRTVSVRVKISIRNSNIPSALSYVSGRCRGM